MGWGTGGEFCDSSFESAIRRGVLIAVPDGAFSPEVLQAGAYASMEDLVGPSTRVVLPAVFEELDGTETKEIQCCWKSVLEYVRGFDPVTEGPGIRCFSAPHMEMLPEPNSLLLAAYAFVEEGIEGRTQFYSAEETQIPPLPATPAPKASSRQPKAKALVGLR